MSLPGTPSTATERPPMYGPMLRHVSLLINCAAGVFDSAALAKEGAIQMKAASAASCRRLIASRRSTLRRRTPKMFLQRRLDARAHIDVVAVSPRRMMPEGGRRHIIAARRGRKLEPAAKLVALAC